VNKIILASNNNGKIKEFREIFKDMDIELVPMKEAGIDVDIEENGETFEENSLIKARTVCKLSGCITIADDSGLEVDYLDGQPGVYSARFMGHDTSYDIKNKAIIYKLKGVSGKDRSARFVAVIAAVFPDGRELVTRGTMEGIIGQEPLGENGFGYDPILFLPEYNKSSAELAPEEKNKISHRGKALEKMKAALAEAIK
jgi:XTP/dITP diphosphohydrolase